MNGGYAAGPFPLARDAMTGETFFRVRVPDTELLNRLLDAAAGLAYSVIADPSQPIGCRARGA
jgi:hypothetical protein